MIASLSYMPLLGVDQSNHSTCSTIFISHYSSLSVVCHNQFHHSLLPITIKLATFNPIITNMNWLVVWNIWTIFPIKLGISSPQLTNSVHHFSEGLVGQPPSSHNLTQIYKKRWCPSSDDPDEKGPKGSRLNQSSHHWLVVWTIFSIYWECHNPNWRTHIFIYFSEGWVETTNQTNIWTISIILLDH